MLCTWALDYSAYYVLSYGTDSGTHVCAIDVSNANTVFNAAAFRLDVKVIM